MFVRCGYPLTYKMLTSKYEHHPKLSEALELLELGQSYPSTSLGLNCRDREELGVVLAKIAVRKRKFGGPQRRIYTQTTGVQDYVVAVLGKLTVRTGDYYKPHTRELVCKGKHHASDKGLKYLS